MKTSARVLSAAVAVVFFVSGASTGDRSEPADLAELERLFREPPADSRIMMRWWWFGPAVTKPQLEREMRLMKAGGIGGFEVQPVYPVALDDATAGIRNLTFLSDEFIDALGFASDKARELGLRIDVTLGSGWPYGGPQVAIEQAAGKLRYERKPAAVGPEWMPSVGAGERVIARFDRPDEALFFIASRTGMMVKRPALGAEGFVLNHYDRAALDAYLDSAGDRLMRAFGSNPPHAIFCDSLEVYESDWTADFLDQFRHRRGYDLKPHLPALVSDGGTPAIRHDWGQTLTELLNERFVVPMREWAHRNGTRFRLQGYGTPPATLSTNALADLPEGEGAQWKTLSATRWASSASHIFEKPVTSSETWTWLHSPSFRATPLDLKAEADLHFLQGINQLVGHGWPYTAEGVEYPGWRFYAAGVFNEKNPWWIVMPDLSRYLQRISFLLRQGTPANDIALYLPTDDAWAQFSPGRVNMIETLRERLGPDVVPRILEAGFNFDLFDDDALRKAGRLENGALRLGAGRYKAVILPGVERMPIDTLRTLEAFAEAGGALVATRRLPEIAPGFLASDADHAEVREVAQRMFQSAGAPGRFVRDESAQLGAELRNLFRPDVALSPENADIGFVHRRTDFADIYFVVNTSNISQRVEATFRVENASAEWWNPLTGRVLPAERRAASGAGTTVALHLEPYGSRVLVFAPQMNADSRRSADEASIDLSSGWTVTFEPGAKPLMMDRLRSWTDDEATRYFSGLATYEKQVVVPLAFVRAGPSTSLGAGRVLRLDLGEGQPIAPERRRFGMQAWLDAPAREAAVVYINGRRAGSIWCPPYSVDVTGLVRPGPNTIRIVVGNLAINHMAGRALPDYRLLNLRYGVRFEPQDMDKVQPVPAGLLGPIRLIAD